VKALFIERVAQDLHDLPGWEISGEGPIEAQQTLIDQLDHVIGEKGLV